MDGWVRVGEVVVILLVEVYLVSVTWALNTSSRHSPCISLDDEDCPPLLEFLQEDIVTNKLDGYSRSLLEQIRKKSVAGWCRDLNKVGWRAVKENWGAIAWYGKRFEES